MVEKRKRKRKYTLQKRKINIFIKELKWVSIVSIALMVIMFKYRKRQRNTATQNLPFVRAWNFHGPTLGSLLLWILPHNHQDGCLNCQEK